MATSAIIPQDARPWNDAKGILHNSLLEGLAGMGYQWMTPVQQKVLFERPVLHSDCLVQAKTGTGKTIAFLAPALHHLLTRPRLPRGQVAILVVSPTRELALQIVKECDNLIAKVQPPLECHAVYGGSSKERHLKKFCDGDPKIVVATPGRLNDYLSERSIASRFANLQTLVLDEADQMLEAGFLEAINLILQRLPPKSKGWQGMCFSATMPGKIEGVLPKVLNPGHARLSTLNLDETPTIDSVVQHFVILPSVQDVYPALRSLLAAEYEISPRDFKVIVFGTTANNVALMHSLFSQLGGIQVFQLQSRLTQSARTRTTEQFKAASEGIMFASDVIGRGMDFPNVSLVVQVGLPSSGEQYVHRVGRTARAGNEGRATILLTERESFFLKVNKRLPISPYPVNVATSSKDNIDAITAAFERVEPSTKAKAYQAWLGFHKTYIKQLRINTEELVGLANEHAAAMGCLQPPVIDKKVVGKMGLKGVKGLNVGQVDGNHNGRAQEAGKRGGAGGNRNAHLLASDRGGQPVSAPGHTGRVAEENGVRKRPRRGNQRGGRGASTAMPRHVDNK